MPGQDNDRLEQFFRKATNKPQLTFSEEDWKKLEARLDAADAAKFPSAKTPKKIITASAVALILLSTIGIWWYSPDPKNANTTQSDVTLSQPSSVPPLESGTKDLPNAEKLATDATNESSGKVSRSDEGAKSGSAFEKKETELSADLKTQKLSGDASETIERDVIGNEAAGELLTTGEKNGIDKVANLNEVAPLKENGEVPGQSLQDPVFKSDLPEGNQLVRPLSNAQVREELIVLSSAIAERNAALAERNEQKAPIELPGAEEADTIGRQTMVEEEHASDKKEHVARPRLSLLLSFAPDFSGTSLSRYSAPGKAFGAMVHYHLGKRWSVSAGVIKNNKTYTGDGEDYTPPKGYWKYYTNGVIPESIDGSCSVLEFPMMVQYTVLDRGRNRWVLGAGTSSYLMQSESYRYHFDQPNPGAKEGWDSRNSSRFLFNMLNVTIGYERQVMPGLMVGIEPYVKLPLERIGWSSLKLYSTGASVTLRYSIIGRKQIMPAEFRSRGPD